MGLPMAERDDLERQAIRCRRLASSVSDALAVEELSKLADELEARIRKIDAGDGSRANSGRSD